MSSRFDPQIERHYRPKAPHYERVASRLPRSGDVLGGCAALLGAGAATFGIGALAAWAPAVTTVSASLTAQIAASRYDHQVVEFLPRELEDALDSSRRPLRSFRGCTPR